MALESWYKVVQPRSEVRQGRSFNPDEFAIALEQVVAGTAPEDYRDAEAFFTRTCFTRALRDHTAMVLRRLGGETVNAAPVMTLVTQFGGGKTHTLTALYHLVQSPERAERVAEVGGLLRDAGLSEIPRARAAVFVGNAWDPGEGRETPWIDMARQLAGSEGVAHLGPAARTTPPGTEALGRVFQAAGVPVLLLFDEVLNFVNRHRGMADPFHAFLQNLTVAMTGAPHGAAVISLPRSQIEMSDFDLAWQDRITKVVRRVAKDLIANDEAEVSEVVRRRLFESNGPERVQRRVSKAYADWCFERRERLPPEWTLVDSTTEKKAREHLRSRFEACYPFHPATLSVFQRKWNALPQFQQTRGTLAMLAQWVSWAQRDGYREARTEPLITLGSAPLHDPHFVAVVLGQLGEPRLAGAIDVDIAGERAHARGLDQDTKGPLRSIHRRVGATILFESSGGQVDKTAHLPELRFALGEPNVDTTSVDSAALDLEQRGYFVRRVGGDGFRVHHQPTIRKVVSDRRAALDEQDEIRPAMRSLVKEEFDRRAAIPRVFFPEDGAAVPDSQKLTLVVIDPETAWTGESDSDLRSRIVRWTRERGSAPRLHPGALIWTVKKPGRGLRDQVEQRLAWKRVEEELRGGTLGAEIDGSEKAGIARNLRDAENAAKEEVWGDYRFLLYADGAEPDRIAVIDLGAGHSSSADSLCGRALAALRSRGLLNDSVGPSYVERNWPPANSKTGAWPLSMLRKCFLDGSLTRLIDPDAVVRSRVLEWVADGEFGLGSGGGGEGLLYAPERVWFRERVPPEEVMFDPDVCLLKRKVAERLKAAEGEWQDDREMAQHTGQGFVFEAGEKTEAAGNETTPAPECVASTVRLRLEGQIPSGAWNRVGLKLLPRLRAAANRDVTVHVRLEAVTDGASADALARDLRRALEDLDLAGHVRIDSEPG